MKGDMMTSYVSGVAAAVCSPTPVAALSDSSIKAPFASFIKISVSINICLITFVI